MDNIQGEGMGCQRSPSIEKGLLYSRKKVCDTWLLLHRIMSGNGYSILPGMSLSVILYVSIVEGSFTTATFARFIAELLDQMNPFPK
jgi:hypothetical protein